MIGINWRYCKASVVKLWRDDDNESLFGFSTVKLLFNLRNKTYIIKNIALKVENNGIEKNGLQVNI